MKLLKVPMLVPLIVGGMAFSSSVYAQEGLPDMSAVDADGNGAISVEEARVAATGRYVALDANKDGVVSQAEFVDARLGQLAQADADGDGEVTRSELRSRVIDGFRQGRGR